MMDSKKNIMDSKKTIFNFFFDLELNIQLYHWLTLSYARHVGSDKLFKNLLESIDKFIEVYIGIYGRPNIIKENIQIRRMSDDEIIVYLKKTIDFLNKNLLTYISKNNTDLLNIRDDLIAQINQAIYLFTLN